MRNEIKILCLVGLIACFIVQPATADDKDLLRSVTAPPNVLVILDSGASMTHDPESNTLNYLTCGDANGRFLDYHKSIYGDSWEDVLARGSKLNQAKTALQTLFDVGFDFNFGFSYYEKSNIEINYLNFVYVVKDEIDTTGDGSPDTPQGPMLSGITPGTPLRFGDSENQRGNTQPDPFFPIRYGRLGDEISVEDANYFGDNSTYQAVGDSPSDGDRRLISKLVDSNDLVSAKQLGSPSAIDMYYYPAYDFSALSVDIRNGLKGTTSWIDVAVGAGINTLVEGWEKELYKYVVEDPLDPTAGIKAQQIGSWTLYIKEEYEVYDDQGQGSWDPCDLVTCPELPLITEVEYSQHFVLYDHPYTEDHPGSGTLSALDYTGSADCQGYLDPTSGKTPIVPPSQPDVDGNTADTTWRIETFLGPQTDSVFYFPGESTDFLPAVRDDYIPLTESVAAIGRRPIKDTVNEAKFYFTHTIANWADPLAGCRDNFLILITDGIETCSGGQAICSAADNFPGAIYTIYLGPEPDLTDPNYQDTVDGLADVECLATNSGGAYKTARNQEELIAALLAIGREIEERTRGFSSPMVPSVEASTKQMAYVSTFTPFQLRSVWQGHLRAYPINPMTGVVAFIDEDTGAPEVNAALWDAGDVLAVRDFATADPRKMYFGVQAGSPTRRAFDYPGFGADTFDLRSEFYPLVWPGVPVPVDYDSESEADDRVKLHQVIDFIRGEQFGTDADENGNDVALRHILFEVEEAHGNQDPVIRWLHSSSYLWCGPAGDVSDGDPFNTCTNPDEDGFLGVEKLGDIFHSVPQRMSSPSCFSCYLSDYQNYRVFLAKHRERRTVMFAGANDGSMHAFDAGLWDGSYSEPQTDAGTGRELFAWVPGSVMDKFPVMRYGTEQFYTVDGTGIVSDVFVTHPSAVDRQWRTFLMWGQRRGGRSYVALDITQPDTYAESGGIFHTNRGGTVIFETQTVVDEAGDVLYEWESLTTNDGAGAQILPNSGRDAMCANGGEGCTGTWPAFRWEFTDTSDEEPSSGDPINNPNPGEGAPDLGFTWSRPLVGFVNTSAGVRNVAFFGGGYSFFGTRADPENITGNWIYGVNVETGEILLKQEVDGMVPGDVQGLDLDLNGFLEKLYFGTTNGNLYRIDLTTAGTVDGGTGRVTNWIPEKIFDAPETAVTMPDGSVEIGYQPFFTRPAIVPISFDANGTARVAIAIGSGNRDDILELNPEPHRFYVFKEPASGDPAVTEGDLEALDLDSADQTEDFLASSTVSGWYLELYDSTRVEADNWEKVNTNPLVLNYQVIFSTFRPVEDITMVEGTCYRGGSARTYVVGLSNANSQPGEEGRFEDHGEDTAMVSDPVVYLGADGKIHVMQATDNLKLEEPIASFAAPVAMVNWKEE